MPTTRAARAAARAAAALELLGLPADVLGLVLYQLTLAHDIAEVAPTCRALCEAAKLALKLRPFSGKVETLGYHDRVLQAVAAAPDGRIITGSFDKTVKIWRDGKCVRTINAHTSLIWSVDALSDGRFLTGSVDQTARLWQPDGTLERTFAIGKIVLCIAALPDGVHFALGAAAQGDEVCGEVRLYHVDGMLVHTFTGHTSDVWTVVVTPDGKHIISGAHGAQDTRVKVWNVASKSLVSTCAGHTHRVVAAIPDNQRFLSGGGCNDTSVRVWLLDGTLENTFTLHAKLVTALVALPDNQHALSSSADKTVKLFNVNDGAALRTFTHHTDHVYSLALLPDGLRIVSGSHDMTARIAEIGLEDAKREAVLMQTAVAGMLTLRGPLP